VLLRGVRPDETAPAEAPEAGRVAELEGV
jgi:hypothetical protein